MPGDRKTKTPKKNLKERQHKRAKLNNADDQQKEDAKAALLMLKEGEIESEDDEDYSPSDPETPSFTPPAVRLPVAETQEQAVKDAIWKRTRAHLNLGNIDLEQLEAYLQESPPSSPALPLLSQEDTEAEYRNFLLTLQTGDLEEDDNDTDYNFSEEFSSLSGPQPFDSEEYRNDRAVHVSRQELDALMEDAAQIEQDFDVDETGKKRKKTNLRRIASATVENLKPIRPMILSTASAPTPALLSPEQLLQLKEQMATHFQLLVQVFLLARLHLSSDSASEQDKHRSVIVSNWDMLNELNVQRETHILRQSFNPLQGNISSSTFDIPALSLLQQLYDFTLRDKSPSSNTMTQMLSVFQPCFNPYFNVSMNGSKATGSAKARFSPTEDQLLAIGLERFGHGNWGLIQRHFLPTKTEKQIKNRYKNMSSKQAQDNPIKSYKLSAPKPLSADEEHILYEAVQLYGLQWDLIAQKYFPQREPKVLERIYLQAFKKEVSLHKRRETKAKTTERRKATSADVNQYNINENFLETKSKPKQPDALPKPPNVQVPSKIPLLLSGTLSGDSAEMQMNPDKLLDDLLESVELNEEPVNLLDSGSENEIFEEVQLDDSSDDEDGKVDETMLNNPFAVMCIKWTKEEDRHILTAAKVHGASSSSWHSLVAAGLVEKTAEQVAERYSQLLTLFKTQNREL